MGEFPNKTSQFQKGVSGNPHGRPKGALSKKTIVKEILVSKVTLPEEISEKMQEIFPDFNSKNASIGETMVFMQVAKAITAKDSQAFKMLFDIAYPDDEIETESENEPTREEVVNHYLSRLTKEELTELITQYEPNFNSK